MQHPISKCWSTPAVVVEIGPHRDYLLKTPAGRLFRRNRRMLRKRVPVMPGTKSTSTPTPPAPIPVKPKTTSATKSMPPAPEPSPKQAKPHQRGKPKPPTFALLRRSTRTTKRPDLNILTQGTLLDAYGNSIKVISSFDLNLLMLSVLQKKCKTCRDLLKVARVSEERFAHRLSGCVQPIDCKWLANMLPEIQAGVRASKISPSEDAKEKLPKLRTVVIDPHNESYSMEIRLEPTGSLSMEELKQAFQLLDMAVDISVADCSHNTEDLVGRTRRNVGQIEQLSEVFGLLFSSGCISYTFRKRIVIELADLEKEIDGLSVKLAEWNQRWKEIEEMSLLALFSRGVVVLNVSRELLVGSALAAYISLTRQSLEPNRILFVTTNTDKLEVERFMKLWSVANVDDDDDDDVTMLMTQSDLHALLKSI
ncbi:hypothetical protein DAPPUDRAFT_105685 [Daphnia pulex]|uniref:Uncharacterized protein n=1 Tax=Daphnia pulex TaxID=6669 RepID=E9GRH5_DAPPU|nr:hypothetical protein DAPPUDRAFT_105685 [Daphnia pulex]|eukprot:EFX77913.1 hypothetical protein DAPPUDRAFT_105685 [Daphnia pulex]